MKKILVISPSWIGDAVMAQSLYKMIKKDSPETILEILAPGWTLAIHKRMLEVDASILSPFNHGELSLKKRFLFSKAIREKEYDQAIILTNSFKSALIPFFAKVPVRTGWLGEQRYGVINDIRDDSERNDLRMIDRFAALNPADNPFLKESIPYPQLSFDQFNVDLLTNRFGISLAKRTIALCPGAEFGVSKRWPTYYFSVVASYFLRIGWNAIILGSERDSSIAAEIVEGVLEDKTSLFDLTGKTSIEDALDLLSISKLVLTNDSGLMHLAAGVGTPLVALYGPTSPKLTPPLISKSRILSENTKSSKARTGDRMDGYHSSLVAIRPDRAIAALNDLL